MEKAEEEDEDADEEGDAGYRLFNNPEDTTFSVSLFGHDLTFSQLPADQSLGHGSVVWEAAVIFAKWVEVSSEFTMAHTAGKVILELGSGTGLAGVALMMRGGRLVFSDLAPVCAVITAPNVAAAYRRIGGLSLPVAVHAPAVVPVDWTDEDNLQELPGRVLFCGSNAGVGVGIGIGTGAGVGSNAGAGVGAGVDFTGSGSEQRKREAAVKVGAGAGGGTEAEAGPGAAPEAGPEAGAAHLVSKGHTDIVLLTDCVFSELLVPHLMRTVLAAIASNPRHAIVYGKMCDVCLYTAFLGTFS